MTTPPHHQGIAGAKPPTGAGWGPEPVPQFKVAARCIEDPAYALAILDGEDHPHVREAILADLHEELGEGVDGYLNAQPIPPDFQEWRRLTLTRLHRLAVG